MKYIRTKDENNLIIDMTDMQLPYNLTDKYIDFNRFGRFDIVRQADTIEELCDEFVFEETYPSGLKRHIITEDVCVGTQFGAIWTDKGLIYVAKMNEEGVLCLI